MSLRTVGVLVLEPVAVFEFGVAVEVFGTDRSEHGLPVFDFRVCGEAAGVPLSSRSVGPVQITPPHGLDGLIGCDLVVVDATPIRRDEDYPVEALQALRDAYDAGATLLSLCSGSFLLGAAGLLDGRPCTTHWLHAEEMQRRYPSALLDPSVLFVDDGQLITSAGTAAGVDASLHLIRRELGSSVASMIARRMVVPPQRDGGQRQFVPQPIPACNSESLSPVLTWAVEHLDEEHTVASLGAQAMMSERTFARRFAAETGTTPHRWLNQQRVLAARDLLERSDLTVEQVAARVGFGSTVVLRDHFRRATGLSPVAYRQRFAVDPLE